MPATYSNISQHPQEIYNSIAEDGLVVAKICRRAVHARRSLDGGSNQVGLGQLPTWKFWKLEWGQIGGACIPVWRSWKGEAKPFLIMQVTETFRWPRRWVLFSWLISALSVGTLSSIAYTIYCRTMGVTLFVIIPWKNKKLRVLYEYPTTNQLNNVCLLCNKKSESPRWLNTHCRYTSCSVDVDQLMQFGCGVAWVYENMSQQAGHLHKRGSLGCICKHVNDD